MWVCTHITRKFDYFIFTATPTPYSSRSRDNRSMTPPSTDLRRGCLSDKARSTVILAGLMTPLSLHRGSWPLGKLYSWHWYVCFVLPPQRPFTIPCSAYRRLSQQHQSNLGGQGPHTCGHSLPHAGLAVVVIVR